MKSKKKLLRLVRKAVPIPRRPLVMQNAAQVTMKRERKQTLTSHHHPHELSQNRFKPIWLSPSNQESAEQHHDPSNQDSVEQYHDLEDLASPSPPSVTKPRERKQTFQHRSQLSPERVTCSETAPALPPSQQHSSEEGSDEDPEQSVRSLSHHISICDGKPYTFVLPFFTVAMSVSR